LIILYSNRTGRLPPIPTLWPRQQPPAPPLQLPVTDIHSSSTPPLFQFQAQRGGFDTGTEDQLAWDEFRVDDVLATMESTPQQADELAASHFTQPPPVLTQPSQLGTDGATTGGGATPRVSERHRRATERHRRVSERHQRAEERHRRVSERHRRAAERHRSAE
jgi:hypothetical protein